MKKLLSFIGFLLCLVTASEQGVRAQAYSSPKIVVSADKVRHEGKVFYSHVVQERQTLYSICKVYNVTEQEIFEANKALNLEKEGLKKDQILLIPVKDGVGERASENASQASDASDSAAQSPSESVSPAASVQEAGASQNLTPDQYTWYRAKWYDDLESIAKKFSVSEESLININALESAKLKRRQLLKIPKFPKDWEGEAAKKRVFAGDEGEERRSEQQRREEDVRESETEKGIFDGLFHRNAASEVSISLLLPANSKTKANESILDFYSGALMAAKKTGNEGIDLDLNVVDISGGALPQTSGFYSGSDFCIGPVSGSDVQKALGFSSGAGWIVSPLDPKVEAAADSTANLIQAPAPASSQVRDVVDWLKSDTKAEDKVILVTQKGVAQNSYATSVISALKNSGLSYSTLSFTILEGRDIFGKLSAMASKQGATRVIMASDSEAFATEVVRNLYMLTNSKEFRPVFYSTSRIRSFETIDLQQLHSINLHVSLSYYVDYNSPEVNDFVMEYRALFRTEPNQFAFQGYDLTRYFASLYSKYGNAWEDAARHETHSGLQADFRLWKKPAGGYVNNAVRRIVYNPDYSVDLLR